MRKINILYQIEDYENQLKKIGIRPFRHNERFFIHKHEQLEYIYGRLNDVRMYLANGEFDRAVRLFGFIQGVLFADGLYCLEDLDLDS